MKQYIFLIISFLTISLGSSAQDYNDISDNGTFATENTKRDKNLVFQTLYKANIKKFLAG